MANLFDVYFSKSKGITVEVLNGGGGSLQVDGEPMVKLDESSRSGAAEKHVPVIEKTGAAFKVKVGSVQHPMDTNHYIMWIELIVDDNRVYRQILKPGDLPEATFEVSSAKEAIASKVVARAFCNLHGLWESEYKV